MSAAPPMSAAVSSESAAPSFGSSMPHKWPRHGAGSASTAGARERYSVEVAAGATYMRLRGRGREQVGGGLRGKVCGFSRASRKRLLDRLNTVPVDLLSSALFVTLTFPNEYPEIADSKRMLRAFIKRLRRRWPQCSGVWRMERVPRMSGSHVGELAPHYHILLFNVPWLSTEWLARSWYQCVGSGDERHLRAGTSVQRVRSRRGAVTYAAKYMCKEEIDSEEWTGRLWSVFGVAWLAVVIRTFTLSREQFYRLRRVLRAYVLKSWRGRGRGGAVWRRYARAPGLGCTAYLSEPMALRLLSWCAGT